MIRETFPVGPLQCNCTVLGDEATQEAVVVDPGGDLARIDAVLLKHGLHVTSIVVTHAHLDHIAGAKLLSERTGAPLLYNQRDLPLVARWTCRRSGSACPRLKPERPMRAPKRVHSSPWELRRSTFFIRLDTHRAAFAFTFPRRSCCWPVTRFSVAASAERTCLGAMAHRFFARSGRGFCPFLRARSLFRGMVLRPQSASRPIQTFGSE